MAEREEPKTKIGNLPRKMQIICKFWMIGTCNKDDKCEYLHNNTDYKKGTNAQIVQECPMYALGFCKNGVMCKFDHTKLIENQNPYKQILTDENLNLDNSEILPLWYLEYFYEKPIGLIFEEFENENKEEVEKMKLELNIDPKLNIFNLKNIKQIVNMNCVNPNVNNGYISKNSDNSTGIIEKNGSFQNLSSLGGNFLQETNESVNDNVSNSGFTEYGLNFMDVHAKIKKNSEISSRKTSDPISCSSNFVPGGLLELKTIKEEENEKNEYESPLFVEETKNIYKNTFSGSDGGENSEKLSENASNSENLKKNLQEKLKENLEETSTRDDEIQKILLKYPMERFHFQNTNFFPSYNYSNYNYKNYINSTHFQNGFIFRIEDKDQVLKYQQRHKVPSLSKNNQKSLKNQQNNLAHKSLPSKFVSSTSFQENQKKQTFSNQNSFCLGKASLNRNEIMNNLLSKSYPNDIYAYKKNIILSNLNKNVKYFFIRYKNFDLIRFSMETDLIITKEEFAFDFLDALNSNDDVILIYFDDIGKDFYGFSKVKFQVDEEEVKEYLQQSYLEVIDLFNSQFSDKIILNFNTIKSQEPHSFLKIEWLWKTKLSYDKVEILRNPINNNDLFIDSHDGQEISADLGFYVCRLMIKRLTKDEVQDYLNSKKQLEIGKIQNINKQKLSTQGNNIYSMSQNCQNFDDYYTKNAISNIKKSSHWSQVNIYNNNINFNPENLNNNINEVPGLNTNKNSDLSELKARVNYPIYLDKNTQMRNINKDQIANLNSYNNPRNTAHGYGNLNDDQVCDNRINYQEMVNINYQNQNTIRKNVFLMKNINLKPNHILNIENEDSKNSDYISNIEKNDNECKNTIRTINIDGNIVNMTNPNVIKNLSKNKNYLTEDFKTNLSEILLKKINSQSPCFPNLSSTSLTNLNNNNANNNIIVTNISNLQVNISQNTFKEDTENKYNKERSKYRKKEKKYNESKSRSRSISKSKIYAGKIRKMEMKKKKHIKNSKSRSRSQSPNDKYNRKGAYFCSISKERKNNSNYDDSYSSKSTVNNTQIIKKYDGKGKNFEKNKGFQIFEDDEVDIDKLLNEMNSTKNNYDYDSDATVKNELDFNPRNQIKAADKEKTISNLNLSSKNTFEDNSQINLYKNKSKKFPENMHFLQMKRQRSVSGEKNDRYHSSKGILINKSNLSEQGTFNYKINQSNQERNYYNNNFTNNYKNYKKNNDYKSYNQQNLNFYSKNRNNSYKYRKLNKFANYSDPNAHAFESRLKKNKLFSNAIEKVTTSFLKEKTTFSPDLKRK